ncbi:zinc finger BED domain-containing protein RICESLEEPER 3-like [Henckelia pumila]|uniref:zinc finger BED domain-containing protein RICESLEEPER 3-like n=1 Tax=Henckelia pumila TaxID=405737 RepID=UPI003C6DBFA8
MEHNTSKMLSVQESSEIESRNLSKTDLKRQSILAKYKRQKALIFGDGSISELDKYLNEMVEEYSDSFDILGWWKQNYHRFPTLAKIARDVLAIPISTVASESTFSIGGRVLDCFRSSLTLMVVESLICTQDWLRSFPIPINVEESLEDVEKLERDSRSVQSEEDIFLCIIALLHGQVLS